MTPRTRATATLTNAADKAGYALYVTNHSHTYIRQATIHTRLLSQRFIFNGHLHTFLFKGEDSYHTTILCIYAFQRAHKDYTTRSKATSAKTETPQHFKQHVLDLATELRTIYDPLTLIIMGDLQHTIADNSLYRMDKHQPAPPANILTPCLHHPLNLVSFIPIQYPTMVYHTWFSKSGERQAGIDHILISPDCIHPDSTCGVDHEISNELFKTDHRLLFATIYTHLPNTASTPPTTTRFQYRRVAQISLKKTYPKDANDTTPPWFAPKTIGILPTDVRSHARMYEALTSAQDHPKAQANLDQMTQHLAALVSLTASLYHTHCSTIPRPKEEILIPRTSDTRHLINNACTSWKLGIEQMMRTSKLITTHKLRTAPSRLSALKVKAKLIKTPTQPNLDDDLVTYRDTFAIIDSTLARHGLMAITLKRSIPTIININRPHITLIDNILASITDKHAIINKTLLALEHQHRDAHDTRLVQIDEYRRHHTTTDAGIHTPTKTQSTERHLIATSANTTTLAAAINTPHTTISTHTKYDTWSPSLPSNPVFLKTDTPTDICRKHINLQQVNRSAIHILRQIKRQLINTIGRQRTDTINHDININQIRRASQAARPRIMSAPQLCIAATHPQPPGKDPITVQTMTIPEQIQAMRDTYGR